MKNYREVKKEVVIKGAVWYVGQIFQATPKAKYFKEKEVFRYRFASAEKRDAAMTAFFEKQAAWDKLKAAEKQAKRDAQANLKNPYKVGDILYNSWGYDQTNIDFYQVVDVGEKSVKIRPIASEMAGDNDGFSSMSAHVVAIKDEFRGDAQTKILKVWGSGNIYVPVKHGSMSNWDGKPKYMSWYA
jgi:hypothetical protein